MLMDLFFGVADVPRKRRTHFHSMASSSTKTSNSIRRRRRWPTGWTRFSSKLSGYKADARPSGFARFMGIKPAEPGRRARAPGCSPRSSRLASSLSRRPTSLPPISTRTASTARCSSPSSLSCGSAATWSSSTRAPITGWKNSSGRPYRDKLPLQMGGEFRSPVVGAGVKLDDMAGGAPSGGGNVFFLDVHMERVEQQSDVVGADLPDEPPDPGC